MFNLRNGLHFEHGIEAYVLAFDHRDFEPGEIKTRLVESMINGTGLAAGRLVGENLAALPSLLGAMGPAYQAARVVEGMDVIICDRAAIHGMTPEEVLGMLYHEKGHIVLGHTSLQGATGLKEELEADAYAARRVGKKALKSALKKLATNMFNTEYYFRGGKDGRAVHMERLEGMPDWKERMAALT